MDRRRLCFNTPSTGTGTDDCTDDSDMSSESLIEKAFTYTKKFRLQSLIGEAVTLQQKNKLYDESVRRKRISKIRSLGRKQPRLADLIPIPQKKNKELHSIIKSFLVNVHDGFTIRFLLVHIYRTFNLFGKTPRPKRAYIRFRKLARSILLMIRVCNACKKSIMAQMKKEAWFSLIDNLMAAKALVHKRKPTRAFVTFVPNEERELIQLTFDVGKFKRDYISEHMLNDETRNILKNTPGTRTPEQIVKILRCVKAICKEFCKYPLAVQKKISQISFFDKYRYNRVITRRGLPSDGMFFVLTGTLIEKVDGQKQPREITAGQVFGEDDLMCGRLRRRTIITKVETELLYLHRLDYWQIFSMTEDAHNISNLDICKCNTVFQHFPMGQLVKNLGTWTVMKYKYGRLIVEDSNKVDWIYVISSGEAKVYKYLSPGPVDVKARRKKIQETLNKQSPFYRRKQLLDFVQNRDYIKSSYKPSTYTPAKRAEVRSAPPGKSRESRINAARVAAKFAGLPMVSSARKETKVQIKLPDIIFTTAESDSDSKSSKNEESDDELGCGLQKLPVEYPEGFNLSPRRSSTLSALGFPSRGRSGSFMRTPMTSRPKTDQFVKVGKTQFPAFVHVETLRPGHTFGLRACLEASEMGPSVSLVSGECEILQINRKYFMKHCDDALYSLIRLMAKPFPSQDELIDRLDANIQWEEFKQMTLDNFLQEQRERKEQAYNSHV
ncbi:hypothetical protein LOTGIDRAFT_228569 [Lottia gigantea]|uniref:Cyclic nucleotide-binding domain-containing protein n=1 Tax=Lottia gigantea TaxID=225164 RepID=V4BXH3_LOTGI|nr:hypothetical protein LOTGIDRAFT_228569 [Lottia gigantea]ESO93799.1 hypothetical protein LOTGIDRAFT_228569 [Lottia gigantea]